jgi:hypothetical protein
MDVILKLLCLSSSIIGLGLTLYGTWKKKEDKTHIGLGLMMSSTVVASVMSEIRR